MMASFSSVDLRTVNHDPTFYALEFFAFMNIAGAIWFWRLNRRQSSMRYLIPILGSGEPVAATFTFSFSEVFADFENMSGGLADTLRALAWTQYQYFVVPVILGWFAVRLFVDDLHFTWFRRQQTSGGGSPTPTA